MMGRAISGVEGTSITFSRKQQASFLFIVSFKQRANRKVFWGGFPIVSLLSWQ